MKTVTQKTIIVALTSFILSCSAFEDPEKQAAGEKSLEELRRSGGQVNCATGLRLSGVPAQAVTEEPRPTVNSGVLKFKLSQSTIDPCSVSGYVVGSQEQHKIERLSADTFVVSGLEEGEHDVILTGEAFNDADATGTASAPSNIAGSKLQGVRVNDLEIIAGASSTEAVTFGRLGSVVGNVKLAGQTNHEGIEVYIPGTQYIAKTDATGGFAINGVPPGRHDFSFKFEGYRDARVTGVSIHSGSEKRVDNVVMILGAGDAEITLLGPNDQPINRPESGGDIRIATRTVRFSINPAGEPKLMKISENSNFANVQYIPFQSTATYVFKNTEELRTTGSSQRRLSIELLDGSVSNVIEVPIKIDYFDDANRSEVIESVDNFDANNKRTTAINVRLGSIPERAQSVKIAVLHEDITGSLEYSFYDDFITLAFASVDWQPIQTTYNFELKDDQNQFRTGNYTIFVKFRTQDLIESPVFADIKDVQLFPNNSARFRVKHPELNATYRPFFELVDITSPATPTIMLVDYKRPGEESTFPRVDEQTAPETAETFSVHLPEDRSACGKRIMYMKQIHVTTGIESEVFESEVDYICAEAIHNQAMGGKGIASAVYNNKLLLFGGRIDQPVDGGSGVELTSVVSNVCKIYDFDKSHLGNAAWSNCSGSGPSGRGSPEHSLQGSKFVLFGGYGSLTIEDPIDGGFYDFNENKWTDIPTPSSLPDVIADDEEYDVVFTPSSLLLFPTTCYYQNQVLWGKSFDYKRQTWEDISFTGGLNSFPWDWDDDADFSEGVDCDTKRYVWTGDRLVFFGGNQFKTPISVPTQVSTVDPNLIEPNLNVYVYYPQNDTWEVYSDPAITDSYSKSKLIALNNDEIVVIGGSKWSQNKGLKIKINSSGIDVTTYSTFSEADVVPSPNYPGYEIYSGIWQYSHMSWRPRDIVAFENDGQVFSFGGALHDAEEDDPYTFNRFLKVAKDTTDASWVNIELNDNAPFIAAAGTFYNGQFKNNIFAVHSVVDQRDPVYHQNRLINFYDFNASTPKWRNFPNEVAYTDPLTNENKEVSVIRDHPTTFLTDNKFVFYGGGTDQNNTSTTSLRYWDVPEFDGIIYHVGHSPISVHSFTVDDVVTDAVQPGQTIRLGFKLKNAQIPSGALDIQITEIKNATIVKGQMAIPTSIEPNGSFQVKADGTTDYLSIAIDDNPDFVDGTPVKVVINYTGGTYAGNERISGQATTYLYIAKPNISLISGDNTSLNFAEPTNRIQFDIRNTSNVDAALNGATISGACIDSTVGSDIPSQVDVGETLPAYFDIALDAACTQNVYNGIATIDFPGYGTRTLTYRATNGYLKTFVWGDDASENTNLPLFIADDGVAVDYQMNITGVSGPITNYTLVIHNDHSYSSDLVYRMLKPGDATGCEFDEAGGPRNAINNYDTSDFVGGTGCPSSGYYAENDDIAGLWTIRVHDAYNGDDGNLTQVLFTIEYLSPTP